jgi:hypothetical protein
MHPTYLEERNASMLSCLLKRLGTISLLLFFTAVLPLAQAAPQAPALTADLHKAKGVTCMDCHGKALKKTFVPAERCLGCHGPAADLIKKTAAVKPENPHDSPHWGAQMDCTVCHHQHEKTVNWCNHCHAFGFKVP